MSESTILFDKMMDSIREFAKNEVGDRFAGIDFDEKIKDALSKQRRSSITVKVNKKKPLDVGVQHKEFEKLLTLLGLGLPVYLVGEAGGGKTMAVAAAAKALGRKFYAESVSQQTPVSALIGFIDARGRYCPTNFRKAFEEGGIFLLDEMDAGNPNVIASMNNAVACQSGSVVSFPDGMIERHPEFHPVAAANTFGRGATMEYVGRNPLDAASLDRYVFLEWHYDEGFERAIYLTEELPPRWLDHVQSIRSVVEELNVRLVVSPRAALNGGRMLASGQTWRFAENSAIFKGLDSSTVTKINERVKSMCPCCLHPEKYKEKAEEPAVKVKKKSTIAVHGSPVSGGRQSRKEAIAAMLEGS